MATTIPAIKSLRSVYPELTRQTAQLCRDVMHRQLDPLDHPEWFPLTCYATQLEYVPTPPRLIRVLALAELVGTCNTRYTSSDQEPVPILETFGVCRPPGDDYLASSPLYWLYSPAGPDALTLCSIAPPDPPTRREQQRDPWLYQNLQTVESYRIAVPNTLLKRHNRS